MVIRVYWASVTGNRKIEGDQARVRDIIESYKLDSQWIDITTDRSVMVEMRKECCNSKALPPQIFNDEVYLGNADDMNLSIEEGRLMEWLKMDGVDVQPTTHIVESNENQNNCNATSEKVTDAVASLELNGVTNSQMEAQSSPKESRKTIQLDFGVNEKVSSAESQVDEDRRRRILGIAPAENNQEASIQVVEKKSSDITTYDGVSKIRSQFEVENAA